MRHKHTSFFLNSLTIGILLIFTLVTPGKAQFVDLGQDPCSTRWRQIKTDNFQIIYPDFFEDNAQYLANIYEKLYAHANTLGIKPKRMSMIVRMVACQTGTRAGLPRRVNSTRLPRRMSATLGWNTCVFMNSATLYSTTR